MADAGLLVLVSFISPFRAERRMARALFEPGEFHEIHVDTPIALAETRDPKGLYKKARRGELKNFTGIDSPYEAPESPEIYLDTTKRRTRAVGRSDRRVPRARRLAERPAGAAQANDVGRRHNVRRQSPGQGSACLVAVGESNARSGIQGSRSTPRDRAAA